MYLYFNENGVLKEIINDHALRKGNANSNVIYAYFKGNPEITTLLFNITPNGFENPIQLNQDSDSPIEASEDNIECFIPWDNQRKLKYFKYFTPYKFYKCTLTAETLSVAGVWQMTLLAINGDQEQVAQGSYVGMVEDNNLQVDSTITYAEYKFLLGVLGSKLDPQALANYQEKLIAGTHITIDSNNVIDTRDLEGSIDHINLTANPITSEQKAILDKSNLNYIIYNGLLYKKGDIGNNVYSCVSGGAMNMIFFQDNGLDWYHDSINLYQLDTQVDENLSSITSLNIRTTALEKYTITDLKPYLTFTVSNSNDLVARMIETPHQLIFDIRCYDARFNSIPNNNLAPNIPLSSALYSRLPKIYNSQIVGYGDYTYFWIDGYKKRIAFLELGSLNTTMHIVGIPDTEQVSLDARVFQAEIKIVIDLLN